MKHTETSCFNQDAPGEAPFNGTHCQHHHHHLQQQQYFLHFQSNWVVGLRLHCPHPQQQPAGRWPSQQGEVGGCVRNVLPAPGTQWTAGRVHPAERKDMCKGLVECNCKALQLNSYKAIVNRRYQILPTIAKPVEHNMHGMTGSCSNPACQAGSFVHLRLWQMLWNGNNRGNMSMVTPAEILNSTKHWCSASSPSGSGSPRVTALQARPLR